MGVTLIIALCASQDSISRTTLAASLRSAACPLCRTFFTMPVPPVETDIVFFNCHLEDHTCIYFPLTQNPCGNGKEKLLNKKKSPVSPTNTIYLNEKSESVQIHVLHTSTSY